MIISSCRIWVAWKRDGFVNLSLKLPHKCVPFRIPATISRSRGPQPLFRGPVPGQGLLGTGPCKRQTNVWSYIHASSMCEKPSVSPPPLPPPLPVHRTGKVGDRCHGGFIENMSTHSHKPVQLKEDPLLELLPKPWNKEASSASIHFILFFKLGVIQTHHTLAFFTAIERK